MTLVLALANLDQVIQISDRQLTDSDGKPCVLPENKAIVWNKPCPCGSGKKYKKCHGA